MRVEALSYAFTFFGNNYASSNLGTADPENPSKVYLATAEAIASDKQIIIRSLDIDLPISATNPQIIYEYSTDHNDFTNNLGGCDVITLVDNKLVITVAAGNKENKNQINAGYALISPLAPPASTPITFFNSNLCGFNSGAADLVNPNLVYLATRENTATDVQLVILSLNLANTPATMQIIKTYSRSAGNFTENMGGSGVIALEQDRLVITITAGDGKQVVAGYTVIPTNVPSNPYSFTFFGTNYARSNVGTADPNNPDVVYLATVEETPNNDLLLIIRSLNVVSGSISVIKTYSRNAGDFSENMGGCDVIALKDGRLVVTVSAGDGTQVVAGYTVIPASEVYGAAY